MDNDLKAVYLNCEDFKHHTFPNVLIEILISLFQEIRKNLTGWFGKQAKSRKIIEKIIKDLNDLKNTADVEEDQVKATTSSDSSSSSNFSVKAEVYGVTPSADTARSNVRRESIERSFRAKREKLRELDTWLPRLKESVREFFGLSTKIKGIFLQIDDLYHLKKADQAFVVDYVHRLCKDVPLYFKIATLRHASTMYVEREGQPIGAQERQDFQPINIDYTFNNFDKTQSQNWQILLKFAHKIRMKPEEVENLFKGEGFSRLVMAGGGVPRDVLSLFLSVLDQVQETEGGRIGKDEIRLLSRSNFVTRIEELKQDSQGDEQDGLLKGIYVIREFCLEKKTNLFLVSEKMLQQNDSWRAIIYKLLDYRIIHSCATALTHKSQPGTFQAFAIDIGCYAHLRKLKDKFTEIDVSTAGAKEAMRSAPILEVTQFDSLLNKAPNDAEAALLRADDEV